MKNHFKVLFRHNAFDKESIESAWAKKLDIGYQLDNILFYATEYSWGDILKTEKRNGELFVVGLLKEMGHSTIRILVSETSTVPIIRSQLKKMGCSSEISNYEKLIAVDIPPQVDYSKIRTHLQQGEDDKKWEYQEACISSVHSGAKNNL